MQKRGNVAIHSGMRNNSRITQLFSSAQIEVMENADIDLHKMNEFITKTESAGAQISELTKSTPQWCETFAQDPDKRFLLDGCAYGFTWEAHDPPEFYEVENFVPPEHEQKVTLRVNEELSAGRIVTATRNQVCGIAATGVVDKQRSGFKKYRIIQDFSRPKGASVNDAANPLKRKFATFKQAVQYLRPRAYHCKVDLKDAYRSIPLAPEWWPRHAFQWKGIIYMDTRMPFGTSGAPGTFDRITQAIVRLMKAHGFPSTLGYLDDFWILASD